MKIDLRSGEVCLQDNQPVRLTGARGLRIVCTAGTIWITLSGQAEDIFLTTNESYAIGSNALTLIESIGNGKIGLAQAKRFSVLEFLRKIYRALAPYPLLPEEAKKTHQLTGDLASNHR